MNLPGFTAEASMYQSTGRYLTRVAPSNASLACANPAASSKPATMQPDLCVRTCLQECTPGGGNSDQCLRNCQERCQVTVPAVQKKAG